MRLEVPCFRQELSYTCVPACLRMVLAYLGEEYVEADLATVCGTSRIGTSEGGVIPALETLGCDYEYLERGDLDTITSWLAEGHPVIVFLRIDHLTAGASGRHAVDVIGIEPAAVVDEGGIVVLNPASGVAEVLSCDRFLLAWRQQGGEGVVVVAAR